jgi:hypothetical protein
MSNESEPYEAPVRGGINERARARMVPEFLLARAILRKFKGDTSTARGEQKYTDEQLDVDPFVEWIAVCIRDLKAEGG